EETTASLTPRLAALGADLLVRTIPAWVGGAITPRAQDEAVATGSRTFSRADGALDWSRPALDLERQVRALNPWPRAYTFDRGKRTPAALGEAGDRGTAARTARIDRRVRCSHARRPRARDDRRHALPGTGSGRDGPRRGDHHLPIHPRLPLLAGDPGARRRAQS